MALQTPCDLLRRPGGHEQHTGASQRVQTSENLFVWGLGLPAVVKKSTVLLLLVYTMLGISVRVDDSLRLMQEGSTQSTIKLGGL